MAVLFTKADDLIFYRRAITRPDSINVTAIHSGFRKVLANNVVGFLVRVGHPTRDLAGRNLVRHEGKQRRIVIPCLGFQQIPLDRAPI